MATVNIFSAELTKYNANNRGTSTGDCVKRALSFAFNIPYIKISQELNAKMKELRADSYKTCRVYDYVILDHGGSKSKKPDRRDMTLNEFADQFNSGTYLVTTGDKPNTYNHIVCVADGVVYDSWDSRKAYVYEYYVVEGVERVLTDIKNIMRSLAYEARSYLVEEGERLIAKYGWEDCIWEVDDGASINGYNFYIPTSLTIRLATGLKKFNNDITFVFTPTTTEEEAHKIIKNTAKVRVYDRFYAINREKAKAEEERQGMDELADAGLEHTSKKWFMSGADRRLYNSLPGWVRGRLTWINVEKPGQYYDSVSVRIYPLSKWPKPDREYTRRDGSIEFSNYTTAAVKDMLDRYYENNELPDRDYDPYEEY